jgi:sterol desaturase/sphingolipid hydroxylase (fatty acid hydroxylase superfamily)
MSEHFVSNEDETVRMFENNWLEKLSRVHWSTPLWIFVPIVAVFVYRALAVHDIGMWNTGLYFVAGIVIWTITEYVLHRYIFHLEPNNEIGQKLHFIMHGVHHDYPRDSKRLVMPPAVSIPLAGVFYLGFHALLGSVLTAPFFAGFLTGYLIYDMTHYAIHHLGLKNSLWLAVKKHHLRHHYEHSDLGYGVSQPFWDYVFDTTFPDPHDSEGQRD